VDITCPQCKSILAVDESFAGWVGECPKCGGEVAVPANERSLSEAATMQIVEELEKRGLGAILVTFDATSLADSKDRDIDFDLSYSDNLTQAQVEAVLATVTQGVAKLSPP
jgi:hypothetical protein